MGKGLRPLFLCRAGFYNGMQDTAAIARRQRLHLAAQRLHGHSMRYRKGIGAAC